MKKAHARASKKLSQKLPRSLDVVKFYELKKGSELTHKEVKGAEGSVDSEAIYKAYKTKFVEIDHYSRIKKAYARNGAQGVIDYIKWVDQNNKRLNELYSNAKLSRVASEIMDIAAKGASNFWNNLIAFFMAFISVFMGKEVEEKELA